MIILRIFALIISYAKCILNPIFHPDESSSCKILLADMHTNHLRAILFSFSCGQSGPVVCLVEKEKAAVIFVFALFLHTFVL